MTDTKLMVVVVSVLWKIEDVEFECHLRQLWHAGRSSECGQFLVIMGKYTEYNVGDVLMMITI